MMPLGYRWRGRELLGILTSLQVSNAIPKLGWIIYDEVKTLNRFQYDEYISQHIIGLSEDVLSYGVNKNEISLVIHFVTVSKRNTAINLNNLFGRVCTGVFVNSPDDAPNLSITSICKNKEEIFPSLNRIKWYVVDMNLPEKVTEFLE